MWQPITLKIKNIFSYEDSTLDFASRKGRMTPIYGSNQTDPNTLSNGSGKTSLLDCLAIALTESPLRKINKKSIVRRGQASGEVSLTLSNSVTSQTLTITRFIEKNKSNKVEIYENSQLNTQLKDLSPKETNKYILSLIDISEDDLLNYYLLGRDTCQSFFSAKDSDKKEVINRFSKANIVDPIEGFIKEDLSKIESELIEVDNRLINKSSKLEVLEEQIQGLKLVDQDELKKKTIEDLQARILTISDQQALIEQEVSNLLKDKDLVCKELDLLNIKTGENPELTELISSIQVLNNLLQEERQYIISLDKKYETQFEELDNVIIKIENDIVNHKKEKGKAQDFISEINRHIADEIECPKCSHKFCFGDKEYDLEQGKKKLPLLQVVISDCDLLLEDSNKTLLSAKDTKTVLQAEKRKETETINLKLKDLNSQLQQLNVREVRLKAEEREFKIKVEKLQLSLSSFDLKVKSKRDNITSYETQIIDIFKQIDVEEQRESEDKITPIQNQIDLLGAEFLEIDLEKINLLEKKENLLAWKLRFKKFKSYLANNSIGMIESLTNHYLKGMGTNLSVHIDGFKEKSDGDLKEEITATLSTDGGITQENFNEFSGGEKSKVIVAGILSLQKLINLNSKSGGLDLLWIDEIIDAIDRVALGELVLSLDSLNTTILLISHIELPDMENVIKIEKKLGISNLVN